MSINTTPAVCTRPQVITYPVDGDVKQARCAVCGQASDATSNRYKLEAWRKNHNAGRVA